MAAQRVILKGRVQGVGFRYFVTRRAVAFPIAGWVRNLGNGDVEIHAEGDPDSIRDFIGAVRAGPPGARVTDCEVRDVEPLGSYGFSVRA